jgi:hypothetical protein
MRDTEIHRRTEKEALQAINDLLDRGFIISYPLTEIKTDSVSRGKYNYRKSQYGSVQANVSSHWYARMKKVN